MTMHLEHPALTTTGRWKTRRRKYASADAARLERELAAEWKQRQAEWTNLAPKFSAQRRGTASQPLAQASISPQYPPGREPQVIPSRPDTPGAVGARPADKVYTGTSVVGIAVQHKSCLQPVFSSDEAKDSAKMRR